MNIVKIILFTISLNFATGLLMLVIPGFELPEDRGGIDEYNVTYSNAFSDALGTNVASNQDQNPATNIIRSLFDDISLKYNLIFKNAFDRYLYGFVTALEKVFGPLIGEDLSNIVFSGLKWVIRLMYAFFIIGFIVNRRMMAVGE